jgi:hypothetical protein
MCWCVTVPAATVLSHRYAALARNRDGSRYRYCLLSTATRPGDESRNGRYAMHASAATSRAGLRGRVRSAAAALTMAGEPRRP